MPSTDYIYCDTCVFMSYFNQVPERIAVLEAFFNRISKSDSEVIITSAITKVEVSWIETTEYKPLESESDLETLDIFWRDKGIVQIVEFNETIADIARGIMRHARKNGWKTENWCMDSIHLATAKWTNSKILNTYDKKLAKFENFIGIKIQEPKQGQLILGI